MRMSDKFELKNPNYFCVERLTLTVSNDGVVKDINALDPYWVERRQLTCYERPPDSHQMVLGAEDAWLARMGSYLRNLKWLLSLEHHRFWSTILYHERCMDSLVSYLQEANPPYMPPPENAEILQLDREIRRLVLIVFSRLITNKESKSCWMTKEYMSSLIYDNFIFTIPTLWDLCLLYGTDNTQHLKRLLDSIFTLQPRYEADVGSALAFVKESFKFVILQVNKNYDKIEAPDLPQTFKGFGEIRRPSDRNSKESLDLDTLRDLVLYLLDTTMTMRIFLELYPKAVSRFKQNNIALGLVEIYEHGVPDLYEKLDEIGGTSEECRQVEEYVDMARSELIDVFREILAAYKSAILSGDGMIGEHVEAYLSVMMDGLTERLLIKDYQACYPVHEDLEMIREAYPEIDTVKVDFILQAIYSHIEEPIPETSIDNEHLTNGHFKTIDNSSDTETDDTDIDVPEPSTDNAIPDVVKEQSLITEVKDIMPNLGEGFILKCLQHYEFDAEKVISILLEDNLPASLKAYDRSLPLIPEDPLDNHFLETGVARLNVFDGDEFDIMTRDDVDVSRIHVGKKRSKYRDLKDMLDDKTEVKKMTDIYSKYNLVCDEIDMYSDEYDDSYDVDGPPVNDGEDLGRPLVTPRVLRSGPVREEPSSSESEECEDQPGPSKSRLDFCTNPEEVRARREASYQARRGRGLRPPPTRNTDVVGKPKGQGQEKEVLHNRDKKEKQKSSRGNRGRRQGAQWKRTQGMMPS